MALEATGHSAGFFPARVSVGVARASAWALGMSSTGVERRYGPAEATVVIGKIVFEFLYTER